MASFINLNNILYRINVLIDKIPDMLAIAIEDHRKLIYAIKKQTTKKLYSIIRQPIMKGKELICCSIDEPGEHG